MADADEMKATLEKQVEQVRDAHHKQVQALRQEISDKEGLISDLTE